MKPYRCPVCNGRGVVQRGFYDGRSASANLTNLTPEQCRSCVGTGIVWGNDGEHRISILDLYEYPKTTGGGKLTQ